MESTKDSLKREFEVTDLGDIHWLLGIQIEFVKAGITLSQAAYIDTILKRFGMTDCSSVSLLIEVNHRMVKGTTDETIEDISRYQQIIGSLMYTVTGTRPDLAYTVTLLSQFSSCPNQQHLSAAKRVLRYLKGTRDQKLVFPYTHGSTPLSLEGYCDSDLAGSHDSRRSTSGYIFRLAGSTICWRSRKQRSVATSTPEGEYMAAAMASKQLVWLQRAMLELHLKDVPSALHCDNTGAIDMAHNPRISDRSKHIDIQYHFVRELIDNGTLTMLYIETAKNLADICTKGLPKDTHNRLRTAILHNG